MATDPIQAIRERAHDTPHDLDVWRTLLDLAALPPSTEAPYLSLSLDWRPAGDDPGRTPAVEPRPSERRARRNEEGVSRRPSRQQIERELAELVTAHGPRGDVFDSVSSDAERITDFLDNELDPAAQGVFIVACSANGVFTPLVLGVPLPTQLVVAPTPALGALAWLVDDHPTYGILLADQHTATLSLITQATMGHTLDLDSTGYPRKQKQGGWSQRRFQARADERVDAFARGIADEVQTVLDDASVTMLVVAGDEVITSALDAMFHPSVKERIIDTIRLDIGASEGEIIAATLPIVERAEREREVKAVNDLQDGIGAGSLGAGGAEATLSALQGGQAAALVVVDDFAAPGWADYSMPLYGVGPVPAEHPAGGNPADITPVALEEELIRLALQTGAAVQIVHTAVPVGSAAEGEIPEAGSAPPRTEAALALDELGGVGALLRFSIVLD